MNHLPQLLAFVRLTTLFRQVERDIFLPTAGRQETSLEHSYQLAFVAWYIASTDHLDLDLTKVLQYAIVHDLVEVYAGDTPLYSLDAKLHATKREREAASSKRLRAEFPEFSDLHRLIASYEERCDPESRFVYAVDKLLPLLSIYTDRGYAWRTHDITPGIILHKNASRVSVCPAVQDYFDQFMNLLRQSPEYFSNPSSHTYETVPACCNA